ncbi:MAG: helix-turn-helix domain-containing protein [Acidimicrobiales bacterium]
MTTIARPDTTAPAKLLDYQELSIWLNDSVRHLRRLVSERRIPYVKVGHFVRFDSEQIHRWLEDNANAPIMTATPGTAVRRSRPSRRR